MAHTMTLTTMVGPDHSVTIKLPASVPEGEVELTVVAVPVEQRRHSTVGDLAKFDFAGMWDQYSDETDSLEIARQVRQEAWKRQPES